MVISEQDTIVAQATAQGRGGVGIVRISGTKARDIAHRLLGTLPTVQRASFCRFFDRNQEVLDEGIALFFQAPRSFTGEDVLELQGHGGPVVLEALVQEAIHQGARLAEPGEFSRRAFLNDKIDLLQAESIAELINARSLEAARSATRSLQGVFSQEIDRLVESLIRLRMQLESTIDFPDEEIPIVENQAFFSQLETLMAQLTLVKTKAKQGALLSDEARVVIVGRPNAGKSSLLNCLTEQESAIVTDIPGTTRDVLSARVSLEGLVVEFLDTAGLRETTDPVEREGVLRAQRAMEQAQHLLLVMDEASYPGEDPKVQLPWQCLQEKGVGVTVVRNKIDKTGVVPKALEQEGFSELFVSVKTGEGLDLLKSHLKNVLGFMSSEEGVFMARRRHLEALNTAEVTLQEAVRSFHESQAVELLAEELKLAQQSLEAITGRFTSDDLLGRIFSEFCIGK